MSAVPHRPLQLHGTQSDIYLLMPVMKKTNMIEIEVLVYLRCMGFQMRIQLLLDRQEAPEINELRR